jgi:uncharacterized protein
MHLLIDGYNLLFLKKSFNSLSALELELARNRLIESLSVYRHRKPCAITVVFDGWQGGWTTERTELRRGIEVVFSKLGEKADEVIKRRLRERGAGLALVSSDRELMKFADRFSASAISSDRFMEKVESEPFHSESGKDEGEEEITGKRKGPSRRLSKKEKRARAALKKL